MQLNEIDIDKLGGIGSSEIGKLYTRDGLKSKTAQTCALEKATELITGYKKRITTIPMQHGIFNEEEAFINVVQPFYSNAKYQSAESILIKDGFWSTPDVIDVSQDVVIDIKCPYSVASYFKNVNKPPATYLAQLQGQMLATGMNNGFLCIYLTSTKIDTYGNKIEYEISIDDRHSYIPVLSDKDMQKDMLTRVDDFFVMRDDLFNDLVDAPEVSDYEFFNLHKAKKVTRLNDKSNLFTWGGMLVKNGDYYYVIQ